MGIRRYDCFERVQNYACKRYMNLSLKVCNALVLGDCNRFPLRKRGMRGVMAN